MKNASIFILIATLLTFSFTMTDAKTTPKTVKKTIKKTQTAGLICSYDAYNCSDFKTKKEATSVFSQCGGIKKDIHRLDADKDGLACENLK